MAVQVLVRVVGGEWCEALSAKLCLLLARASGGCLRVALGWPGGVRGRFVATGVLGYDNALSFAAVGDARC